MVLILLGLERTMILKQLPSLSPPFFYPSPTYLIFQSQCNDMLIFQFIYTLCYFRCKVIIISFGAAICVSVCTNILIVKRCCKILNILTSHNLRINTCYSFGHSTFDDTNWPSLSLLYCGFFF